MVSIVRRAALSPATWLYALVWIVAAGLLVSNGYKALVLGGVADLGFILALSAVTVAVTPRPPAAPPGTVNRVRLYAQTGAVLVVAALIALTATALNHAGPPQLSRIPVFSGLVLGLKTQWRLLSVPLTYVVADPVIDVVLPLVILLALGARRQELGLQRGYRSAITLLVWAIPLVLGIIVVAVQRPTAAPSALVIFGRNFFQNGFSEEFLFRGGLQSRLERIIGPAWGLVVTSLTFGIWHAGADAPAVGRNLGLALCLGIVAQSPSGVGLGIVFQRTRSLIAGTVIHMLFDSPGG